MPGTGVMNSPSNCYCLNSAYLFSRIQLQKFIYESWWLKYTLCMTGGYDSFLKFVSFGPNITVGVDLLPNKHGWKSVVFGTLNIVLTRDSYTISHCTILKYFDSETCV